MAAFWSTIIGGPSTRAIMTSTSEFLGLHCWQWMFLLEGAPCGLLAFVVHYGLTDLPRAPKWLDMNCREWLVARLAAEKAALPQEQDAGFMTVVKDVRVWSLGLLFGSGLVGLYGLILWLPQIIKE